MNTKEHKVMIAARLILAFTIAVISWQATIQNGIEAPPVMNGDKVLHFFAFAVLALLVDFAFPRIRFGAAKIIILDLLRVCNRSRPVISALPLRLGCRSLD